MHIDSIQTNQDLLIADLDLEPGLIIHYLEMNPGGKPTVLFLHGLGATSASWQLQFPSIAEAGYRILAPDMRGFGQSSYPGGANNPEIMAVDTIKFLQKLEVGNCHVIGISMGGTIALKAVLIKPEFVESLILTNTFAKLRPIGAGTWIFYGIRLAMVHIIGIQRQADYVANRLFPHPDQGELRNEFTKQVRQANTKGYRSTMRSYARYDLSDRLREIDVPTLVITGENDSVVPPGVQEELADNISNSRHVIIPNSGHAVSVERPTTYNRVVMDFLESS
jgi:pimeloyl-ACP methyl ester carboxylesterase